MTMCAAIPQQIRDLEQLLQATNQFTNNWLQYAQQALMAATAAGHVNVLVSSGQLIPTLAKLMLYGLSPFFSVDCIYNSAHKFKPYCFEEVAKRFAPIGAVRYVAIGDGDEERLAADGLNLQFGRPLVSFHQIDKPDDLAALARKIAARAI